MERERSARSGSDASGSSYGVGLENLVTVVLEECGLLGAKRADVLGQHNTPLLHGLLDAGIGTQQVAGVCEGNPVAVEQLVDVRGE